jgi:riboflavin kinase/FMN adenylyltransferase
VIVLEGVAALRPEHGRLFVVIGVFDGLHLGHAYLLEHLVREARARDARPTVITFDHHPDEIITGAAPPLLLDPVERLERLGNAGVEVAVVHHFDRATRETPYDAFVRRIADRVDLAGFLMTPESAFGLDRGGTADRVAALGRELGYDVVVVPTLELDGQPIRSTDIRAAIARGDLARAARQLGRAYAVVGEVRGGGSVSFPMPVTLPAAGAFEVACEAGRFVATTDSGTLIVPGLEPASQARLVFADVGPAS